MNPKLVIEITDDYVYLHAVGADGFYTWDAAYRWDRYELDGMPDRVLRDVPEWLRTYAPAWVRQWDDMAAQA